MCGIVAVVAPRSSAEALRRTAEQLTEVLAHRGPDHRGVATFAGVAFGHARLRVVDPTPGADQPMSFGDAHLVFSGAILNYRALRDELARSRGVVFRSHGDTEVLLHALRTWGDAALERLEGMFAFVYYDARSGRLLAARDRVGIKPLVWARRSDGALVIASEAQAIVRAADIERAVDPVALRQILRYNHVLGDRTFFAAVKSVEPGCALAIDARDGTASTRRWWTLRLAPTSTSLSRAADELDVRFRAAIARTTDVDVPFGAYLSGGVDSSGIAAAIAGDPRGPRFYSLVMPGVRYSAESDVDRAASLLGVRPDKVAVTGLSLDDYVEYALRAEMPQWWTSDLALSALSREARRRGTLVILSGEGPDELFAGYEIYRVARVRPLLARVGALLGTRRHGLAGAVVRRFVPWLDVDTSVARAWLDVHHPSRAKEIEDHYGFCPENLALWETVEARRPLLREADGHAEIERAYFREQLGPRMEGLSPLEKNLHFEAAERLPRWILHMGDRMSSTHGVELRFPYLDDPFFGTALRLPLAARATFLEDKRVFRRMHRTRLPRALARRRKQPLYTPTREWLAPTLADPRFSRYWSRASFERVGLLDFKVCDRARSRLAGGGQHDALTGMVDDWLFTFALTTSILAVDLCGA